VSLAVVTASTSLARAGKCVESWIRHATEHPLPIFLILNGGPRPEREAVEIDGAVVAWVHHEEYLGSVRAYRVGVDAALHGRFDAIACLHDDFEIQEDGWDQKVLRHFARAPACGLLGFGGAIGLGSEDMYRKPYDPMSLARHGFRSNLVDAEVHGVRSLLAEPVACLDGFSQVGRRAFWAGARRIGADLAGLDVEVVERRPWAILDDLGIVHHLYDGLLGAIAARHGWETWYLPLRAKHWGGQTAVGDPGYQAWAKRQTAGGDEDFWKQAHAIGYENFRDILPLRV